MTTHPDRADAWAEVDLSDLLAARYYLLGQTDEHARELGEKLGPLAATIRNALRQSPAGERGEAFDMQSLKKRPTYGESEFETDAFNRCIDFVEEHGPFYTHPADTLALQAENARLREAVRDMYWMIKRSWVCDKCEDVDSAVLKKHTDTIALAKEQT